MRKSILNVIRGCILLLATVLMVSCGNVDNALEDIINGGGSGGSGEGGGSSTINATAITLSQTLKVMKLGGDALSITVTFTPSDATDKTVTWESSDEAVATVENGVVTAKTNGIAKITAKSGELTATCEVFVGTLMAMGSSDYTANEYDILTGPIGNHLLTIPNNCKVAFDGLTTTETITCSGNATIILTDGSENTVTAPNNKPGIQVGGNGTTLTINAETAGTGTLTVHGGNNAAGIGTGNAYYYSSGLQCGNITISGGTVNATGKGDAAGIGTGPAVNGRNNECGAITISGGTVTATGGTNAAGIGTGIADGTSGYNKNICGAITIGANVKSVIAQRGEFSDLYKNNSIGKGVAYGGDQICGVIKFGSLDVHSGEDWTTTMADGNTYGELKLAISGDTWTLTPVAP